MSHAIICTIQELLREQEEQAPFAFYWFHSVEKTAKRITEGISAIVSITQDFKIFLFS